MVDYKLVYAPNPIFSKTATPVETVDEGVRELVQAMYREMYAHQGVGIGANMVGSLDRVVVVDLSGDEGSNPMTFINPEITWASEETQVFEEGSLSFPGIAAKVVRPKAIKLSYWDIDGNHQETEADGGLATVIQHEVDYLNGVVFLDHVSKLKRDSLLKKMKKFKDKNHIDCKHHHHH